MNEFKYVYYIISLYVQSNETFGAIHICVIAPFDIVNVLPSLQYSFIVNMWNILMYMLMVLNWCLPRERTIAVLLCVISCYIML